MPGRQQDFDSVSYGLFSFSDAPFIGFLPASACQKEEDGWGCDRQYLWWLGKAFLWGCVEHQTRKGPLDLMGPGNRRCSFPNESGSFVLGYLHKRMERRKYKAMSPELQAKKAEQSKAVKNMRAQLIPILKVAFPSISSQTSIYLIIYTAFLILRIVLTIKIARVTGALGKMISARTFTDMFKLQAIFG